MNYDIMINCVVSRYQKNVDWIYRMKPTVNAFFVYDKENADNPYNVPVNKGQEASVYLKYIVDHYDDLADFTFFIHDDEYAWHHSGSVVDKLKEAVQTGCLYYNINDKNVLGSIITNKWYKDILQWYHDYIERYIPHDKLPRINWTQGYRGSAQFLVHKSLITHLPKAFYEGLYDWIVTTDLPNEMTSRFLEWTWHLFWDIHPKME